MTSVADLCFLGGLSQEVHDDESTVQDGNITFERFECILAL